jgi:hypothetical protein
VTHPTHENPPLRPPGRGRAAVRHPLGARAATLNKGLGDNHGRRLYPRPELGVSVNVRVT